MTRLTQSRRTAREPDDQSSRPAIRNPAGGLGGVGSRSSSAALLAALGLAGCGGSGSGGHRATVAPARTYSLQNFQPAGPVLPGRPTTVSFTIQQPSGKTLTAYRPCCEPHAGVDLIIVRSDDSHIQYDDSDIGPGGQVSPAGRVPHAGRYRVIIDAYPAHTSPDQPINFQLFTWVNVKGAYHPQPVPPYTRRPSRSTATTSRSRATRRSRRSRPRSSRSRSPTQTGRKAVFGTWRGALAHAIFIHQGSLDYFHTHVCSPGAIYCTSVLGRGRVTGSSSQPGHAARRRAPARARHVAAVPADVHQRPPHRAARSR